MREESDLQSEIGSLRQFCVQYFAVNNPHRTVAKYLGFLMKLHNRIGIPPIGFGVYKVEAGEAARVTYNALLTGYRLIDSAIAYGNEHEVGQGIVKFIADKPNVNRSDIFYTTKIRGAQYDYADAMQTLRESFNRVKDLGYIDLVLIHFPSGTPKSRLETYNALLEAQREGWIKHVGVSNYGTLHLKEIVDAKLPSPAVNQIELNPWLQHQDIVAMCRTYGTLVEAYSPLTRGYRLSEDQELDSLAEKYRKSPAQILLRWSVQYGVVPLPKTTHEGRMRENLNIFDFELSQEDFDSLGSPEDYYVSNPNWDPTKWGEVH